MSDTPGMDCEQCYSVHIEHDSETFYTWWHHILLSSVYSFPKCPARFGHNVITWFAICKPTRAGDTVYPQSSYWSSHIIITYLCANSGSQTFDEDWWTTYLCANSGSQTFDEDWWTMLIESGTEWTFNQSYEFKIMNSLSTPRSKTKNEHSWYFVPCINIKEDVDTCIQHNINSTRCKTQVGG
jgi:hypothetical protein